MSRAETHAAARLAAQTFEQELSSQKRKRFGQFFTGLPLGKLLAHLAFTNQTHTVLDPMAGHGDLLDAVAEAATERHIKLKCLHGIEIDDEAAEVCRRRIAAVIGDANIEHKIFGASAFDPTALRKLNPAGYDLVITNPPYIRYQEQNGSTGHIDSTRRGLLEIIDQTLSGSDANTWKALSKSYSGLADLSVPSWLLAGLLVRPGGTLALVVPATWRTREYGDVVRYLLLRAFHVEIIVEDVQPGWFSEALVRTQLVVARRLFPAEVAVPLENRTKWHTARWAQIAPEAASTSSLVGTAFTGPLAELRCSRALFEPVQRNHSGIQSRPFDIRAEWLSLKSRALSREWYRTIECINDPSPQDFNSHLTTSPEQLLSLQEWGVSKRNLTKLEDAQILVGQGLRTGCNRFFYVDLRDIDRNGMAVVQASGALGCRIFTVPTDAIRPVLRRQAEIPAILSGQLPSGRVLDLRHWVLPEDAPLVAAAEETYRALNEIHPRVMPAELASYVRSAATLVVDGGKFIPELSAVRTNIRAHRKGTDTPRFWYMLPEFTKRHLPAAFVGRINHGIPWVECNLPEPILIDANFSTFWSLNDDWTPGAIKALLNSAWCRFLMETLGTPLGGGALKLEAAHLRQLLLPILSSSTKKRLAVEGQRLSPSSQQVQAKIDRIVFEVLSKGQASEMGLAVDFTRRAHDLRRGRQRTAV
jgi:hypothetical protein